jgi:hypothetical protein
MIGSRILPNSPKIQGGQNPKRPSVAVGTTIADHPPHKAVAAGGNWPKNEIALVIEKFINLREVRYEGVQVNFIKLLVVVILCIASVAVLLAVVLPIAAFLFLGFLGPGIGIDVPFSVNVWLVFVFSYPWFSLVLGLGLVIVFGWAAWRLEGLRSNA